MKTTILIFLAGLLSVGLSAPLMAKEKASKERQPSTYVVTNKGQLQVSFDGLGPVKIGMTVPQASSALGVPLKEDFPREVECHYANNEKLGNIWFMISQGRIVRIDIRDPGIVTADGARIGMTEKEIKRIYPNVKSEPNHYEPTSHYLSVSRKGSANLIIFDTDGKTVSQYRIGKVPDVQLVEGCG